MLTAYKYIQKIVESNNNTSLFIWIVLDFFERLNHMIFHVFRNYNTIENPVCLIAVF